MSICSCNGRTFEETKNQVLCFKDYENGELVPDREEALSNIKSGTCVPELFSNVKAALLTDIGSENIYSEDEIIIGRWIDGKPIYRKTLVGITASSVGSSTVFQNVASLNIDRMLKIYGILQDLANGDVMLPVTFSNTSGVVDLAVQTWYSKSTSEVKYRLTGNPFTNRPVYLTIEYTKV